MLGAMRLRSRYPQWMRKSTYTRRAALALVGIVAIYLGSGIAAAALLTRRAHAPTAEPAPEGYRDVRLRTSDGEQIGGWLASSAGDDVAVVIAHGNGASRSALLDEADDLRARAR